MVRSVVVVHTELFTSAYQKDESWGSLTPYVRHASGLYGPFVIPRSAPRALEGYESVVRPPRETAIVGLL